MVQKPLNRQIDARETSAHGNYDSGISNLFHAYTQRHAKAP
jgi:hypothetical protein